MGSCGTVVSASLSEKGCRLIPKDQRLFTPSLFACLATDVNQDAVTLAAFVLTYTTTELSSKLVLCLPFFPSFCLRWSFSLFLLFLPSLCITGPVTHHLYEILERLIPSSTPYCPVKRLAVDRLLFAPPYLLVFFFVVALGEVGGSAFEFLLEWWSALFSSGKNSC